MINISVINTHGVKMPKHIFSGLKYLTAVELMRKGHSQNTVAQMLGMDRTTISHYLNGRNISLKSIEIAEIITNFCPKDFLKLTYALINDTNKTRIIIQTCVNKKYDASVSDSCIGCGLCVDNCLMKAIVLKELKAQINSNLCCGCLMCGEDCPTNSIQIMEVENGR
jgi:4Fe-4S ferredoxin